MTIFNNIPFDKLEIGMTAEEVRVCEKDDLYVFAHASGNFNPLFLPEEDGDFDGKPDAYAPSIWLASLISAVLGNKLPGPGTFYNAQSLRFVGRAKAGDSLVARATLVRKQSEGRLAFFETTVCLQDGTPIIEGEAEVVAPDTEQTFDITSVPGLTVASHRHFERLLEMAAPLPAMRTAVVAPETLDSLRGAMLAKDHTIIDPILIGCEQAVRAVAEEHSIDLTGCTIVDLPSHVEASRYAVNLVNENKAAAIMKGHLHTDDLLRPILSSKGGLKTGRRVSHIFVLDVPGLKNLLMVSDAAINITPDLQTKVDIVQNAIDLAISVGIETPKVGVLSAVETVNPKIPSTLDAAALSKMAERGQITGGIVDGPLAMDNAVSLAAAKTKGITGLVAGQAEVLIAPNLEAGNMLAKELAFIANAEAAGVVMGARCPIVLNSRSDSDTSRLASCAVAALHAARIGKLI